MIAVLDNQHIRRRPADPANRSDHGASLGRRLSVQTVKSRNGVAYGKDRRRASIPARRARGYVAGRSAASQTAILLDILQRQNQRRAGKRPAEFRRGGKQSRGGARRRQSPLEHAEAPTDTPAGTETAHRERLIRMLREHWRALAIVLSVAACLLLTAVAYAATQQPRYPVQPLRLRPDSAAESLILADILPPAENSATPRLKPEIVESLSVALHTVESGETLSGIAAHYGRTLSTIIAYNAVKDARKLQVGTSLRIPNADGLRYTVRRGDNLSKIAAKYSASLNAIRDWNNLATDTIRVGEELFIPGGALSNDEINAVMGRLWIWPTQGEISSRFGYRTSPFSGIRTFHNGVDIHNRTGTTISASRGGTVVRVDISPVYGKYVIIGHNGGWQSLYAHLDTILVGRGQKVEQRQLVGTMGSTGMTTGPHLHFGMSRNGTHVDPLGYIN